MSIDADWLVDRRRLKRRLTWWQLAAVAAILLAVLAALGRFGAFFERAHVARIDVDGIIVADGERDRALADLIDDTAVKAVLVRIDSPGGTVVGGETLYRRLRQIAAHKPVVAVMGELATSAAYMTAIGADWIVAREGTLTGSIGVILQSADVTGLLDKIGVKPETVKSSPLKAQPNPLEPFTPEARVATERVVLDVYTMFVEMVQERRKLTSEQLAAVTDGGVFTGRQARASGLVDALGGEDEARSWLETSRGVPAALPARDVELRDTEEQLIDLLGSRVKKALFSERLSLDGLISVWHPDW
ncbi:MAG: signal peptide peptidase SppA [Rhodospirillales bacterium]|nr:signal peptide peptidase SppA [Rhodospirillales bacterium]